MRWDVETTCPTLSDSHEMCTCLHRLWIQFLSRRWFHYLTLLYTHSSSLAVFRSVPSPGWWQEWYFVPWHSSSLACSSKRLTAKVHPTSHCRFYGRFHRTLWWRLEKSCSALLVSSLLTLKLRIPWKLSSRRPGSSPSLQVKHSPLEPNFSIFSYGLLRHG